MSDMKEKYNLELLQENPEFVFNLIRNEALDAAAKVAEKHICTNACSRTYDSEVVCGADIAQAIRSLANEEKS